MADNVAITAGAGTTIATDDVGGVQYQRVKIGVGADGSATDVSSAAPLPVGGLVTRAATELTRPADTTAYTAGDVVSNSTSATTLIDLASAVRVNGGSGYIVRVDLATDKKSITPRFRVHFFNASNPTVSVDNAAHRGLYADVAKRLGWVDLPAMTTGTDTTNSTMSRTSNDGCRLPVVAGGATTSLYALLEALDAFTPASGQKFTLTIMVDGN
jgi:hypothetical protein